MLSRPTVSVIAQETRPGHCYFGPRPPIDLTTKCQRRGAPVSCRWRPSVGSQGPELDRAQSVLQDYIVLKDCS
ncbi:unnamed protein product [Gadus morhua 'NCC']